MRLTSPQLTRQAPQKTHNPLAKCMLRSGNFRTTMPPPLYKLFHRSEINFVFSEKKIIQKKPPLDSPPNRMQTKQTRSRKAAAGVSYYKIQDKNRGFRRFYLQSF
jgi:hypothetical protein